jgi:polyphosphate kinase 2
MTNEDVKILNTKRGPKYLFSQKEIDIKRVIRLAKYEKELRVLQTELVNLQSWVIENKKKVVILFEGRDAAGKGGAIRRITAHINPRHYKVVALPKPTEDEQGQWYFQRYVNKLPNPGEIVFFDRSWYNRAIVEPVNGFCTDKEYEIFMEEVNQFEKMLTNSNVIILKFYFSISKDEQKKRLTEIKQSPLKRWKITSVDEKALELWDSYTDYKSKMINKTNTDLCPWKVIRANKKTESRLESIKHILKEIPYENTL